LKTLSFTSFPYRNRARNGAKPETPVPTALEPARTTFLASGKVAFATSMPADWLRSFFGSPARMNTEKGVPAMQRGPFPPSGLKVCLVQPSPTSSENHGVNWPRYLSTPASLSSWAATGSRPLLA
jgi:hypothetical protein